MLSVAWRWAVGETGHQNKYILLRLEIINETNPCLQAKNYGQEFTNEQASNSNDNDVHNTKILTLPVTTKYVYLFAQEKGVEWNARLSFTFWQHPVYSRHRIPPSLTRGWYESTQPIWTASHLSPSVLNLALSVTFSWRILPRYLCIVCGFQCWRTRPPRWAQR